MRVLIACEESQVVCKAFRAKGHKAYSCDILDCSGGYPEWHIKGDVVPVLGDRWDMILAFPPCTYLCNSGVRWLYTGGRGKIKNYERWGQMYAGCLFFNDILAADCGKIVVENPRMHGHAEELINDDGYLLQYIHPWQHGHGETKATCLRIKGLHLLRPSNVVSGREARIHKMSPGVNRSKLRSKTLPGVGDAFAEQWG